MTPRPVYPRTDTNHAIVTDVLKALGHSYAGKQLYAVDVSSLGGEMLDYLLWIGQICVPLEIKTPESRERLTSGEKLFISNCPGPKHVVTSDEELMAVIEYYAGLEVCLDGI